MQLALTDLGPTKHFKRDQKVLKHKQTTKRFKCIQLTANTDKCKGEVKALVDNPNVAGTTIKQASLEFLDLQLPPTCPVENLVYELNYLSEALSSCSADHLEGNFHFIHHHSFIHSSAGTGTKSVPLFILVPISCVPAFGDSDKEREGEELLSSFVLWAFAAHLISPKLCSLWTPPTIEKEWGQTQ